MSHIFRIGDRVRIVKADSGYLHLIGTEGVVTNEKTWVGHKSAVIVLVCGTERYFAPESLEPILPDKSLPAEIIAMQELPDCDVADLLRKHEREGVPA